MKRNYVSLMVEVIKFEQSDIITSSGDGSGVGTGFPTDWVDGLGDFGGEKK